jgi:hypothetical protein
MIDWQILGQVLTVFAVLVGGGAGAWAAFKTKGTEAWKIVAEASELRNKQLEGQIEVLRAENQAQALEFSSVKEKLARLEMLPDLSQLLTFLREDRERDDRKFEEVLARLDARFDKLEGCLQVDHDTIIELMKALVDKIEGKDYAHRPLAQPDEKAC